MNSDQSHPSDSYPPAAPMQAYWTPSPVRQSVLGVASFLLALLAGGATCILIVAEAAMESRTPGSGMDEDTMGLGIILAILVAIVGLALGSAGAVQPDRKKVFAVLGLVLNSLMVLVVAAMLVIGIMVS